MGTITKYIGVIILFFFIASTTFAQSSNNDNPQNDPRYKDPNTALIYAFLISGGGHFYAGESGKGAKLLGITYGSILGGYVLGEAFPKKTDIGLGITVEEYNTTPMWIGIAIAAGTYIYSLSDAQDAANRTNAKNGLTKQIQVSPTFLTTSKTNNMGYGLKMKIHF